MDRALVLRYHGCGFESQLARALKERQCTLEGAGPVCKCTGQCTLQGSVQGGG